eukprot:716415-Rhodomonas_salina.1
MLNGGGRQAALQLEATTDAAELCSHLLSHMRARVAAAAEEDEDEGEEEESVCGEAEGRRVEGAEREREVVRGREGVIAGCEKARARLEEALACVDACLVLSPELPRYLPTRVLCGVRY